MRNLVQHPALRNRLLFNLLLVLVFLAGRSCTGGYRVHKPGGSGLNIFSVREEVRLGREVEQQILTSGQYKVLDRNSYPQAYAFMDSMVGAILNSGKIVHKNQFEWRLHLIKDDATLNAFCAPGGKIFVYTGLIKYLNESSSLAGVLGHEMAHADQRHVTEQLTKTYGVETLTALATRGNPGLGVQLAEQLLFLGFSREDEAEADHYSVDYLCPTRYKPDGAADFFQRLSQDHREGSTPQFLSTHPNPENRLQAIRDYAHRKNCGTNLTEAEDKAQYQRLLRSLP